MKFALVVVENYGMRLFSAVILLSFILPFALEKKSGLRAASARYILYKVKKGDNLTHIARKFAVSIDQIKRLNRIRRENHLEVGQRLKIKRGNGQGVTTRISGKIDLSRPFARSRLVKGFRKYGDTRNYGLLYSASNRSTVRVAAPGTVIKVAQMRGYGRYILVDHGKGWISMYSNVGRVKVKAGDYVPRRRAIANVSGNRFFFLLSYKGKPVNPIRYM